MPVSDVICQIVNGELDAAVVARDQEVIAFLDDRPAFKGHLSDPNDGPSGAPLGGTSCPASSSSG